MNTSAMLFSNSGQFAFRKFHRGFYTDEIVGMSKPIVINCWVCAGCSGNVVQLCMSLVGVDVPGTDSSIIPP